MTPLISPAITPSFTYQQQKHHHNNTAGNDIDFSPLSSPAMMPQRDNQQHQLHQSYHQLQQQQDHINSAVNTTFNQMTRNQMCEQYEQLEQAKLLITRRLTELQKHQQQQTSTRISPSNHLDYMNENHQSKILYIYIYICTIFFFLIFSGRIFIFLLYYFYKI